MQFIPMFLLFILMGQNAFAQSQCIDALQHLDALNLLPRIIFRCEPSGGWSVSAGSRSPGDMHPPESQIRIYKHALCVAGSGAQSDIVDSQMREALRQFIAGETWTNAQDEVPEFDAVKDRLGKAVGFFPRCNAQGGQIRNAYELGVYSRGASAADGIKNVDATLELAMKGFKMEGAGTGRSAIAALRTELEKRKGLPQVNEHRDQLDDKLWPMIVGCAASVNTPPPPGGNPPPSQC
jgi:hypothetical protein